MPGACPDSAARPRAGRRTAARRARKIETALQDLGRLAEKLLQLSRAESGIGGRESAIDLLEILDLVVLDFQRGTADGARLEYRRSPTQVLMRHADADAFAIVMRNLIENAFLHGDRRHPVVVTVDDRSVSVSNACDVVPGPELEQLRRRFQRGRTLASVQALASRSPTGSLRRQVEPDAAFASQRAARRFRGDSRALNLWQRGCSSNPTAPRQLEA